MPPTALKELLDGVAISPYEEALAFEYLYAQPRSSLKGIVEQTTACERLPSTASIALCGAFEPDGMGKVRALLDGKLGSFSVAISGTPSWPEKLDDSEHPIPLFYYRGDIGLLESKNVEYALRWSARERPPKRAWRVPAYWQGSLWMRALPSLLGWLVASTPWRLRPRSRKTVASSAS